MRICELDIPIAYAKQIFQKLKSKYPTLNADLVITNNYGQTELTSDGHKLLDHVASSFVDSPIRRELIILRDIRSDLIRRNQHANSKFLKMMIEKLQDRITTLLNDVEVIETTEIHLRLDQLDYGLIASLQVDPLVDKTLTPHTKASIKISLGSLVNLTRKARTAVSVSARAFTQGNNLATGERNGGHSERDEGFALSDRIKGNSLLPDEKSETR